MDIATAQITQDQIETTPLSKGYTSVLSDDALEFLAQLHRRFNQRRISLLDQRKAIQEEIDNGKFPDFLPDTVNIRQSEWKVAPIPKDLEDRRVEITGPVDRKMVINALNSGAKVFMADFEDSTTPTWENVISGQQNLIDAVRKTITYRHPTKDKVYQLNESTATLMIRPRGWHLEEKNIQVDGAFMSASLVDFGLYFFHNAKSLIRQGRGPYFYLPKLENYMEARLWNDVFVFAQEVLVIPQGTIKATVLIENILASFQMNEILFELKDHSAGLNCGRWDYIFSVIKKFKNYESFALPDRAAVGMDAPFMAAYTSLVVQTCHKRGVHAMGGMAAQIPIKNDSAANEKAFAKVRLDKLREVKQGHDGTWVAHPDLVQVAMNVFDDHMPDSNQIDSNSAILKVTQDQLLTTPKGQITTRGLEENIRVGILYLESWLRGQGAVAINHLMEDAATAEISRSQIWQWIRTESILENQETITYELFKSYLEKEQAKIHEELVIKYGAQHRLEEATMLFDQLIKDEEFVDFLTLPGYNLI